MMEENEDGEDQTQDEVNRVEENGVGDARGSCGQVQADVQAQAEAGRISDQAVVGGE